ncbi:MAG TPA: hypothetical protein VMU12_00840 [Candidatus Paceibacterota bacterium]|nr:hypothetical protein [Candidatus Paceibacterota bacterium]
MATNEQAPGLGEIIAGTDLESLDEQRLEQKLAEARKTAQESEYREQQEQERRWEQDRELAAGLDQFLAFTDSEFKRFYRREPQNPKLAEYDKLVGRFRVAVTFFQRDVNAMEGMPTFAKLETLDVQIQELERMASDIHAIDAHVPQWNDDTWRDRSTRERMQARERELIERFSCVSEEIAYEAWQISTDTKVYDGPLERGILSKLSHVEHVLFVPSDEEVHRETVDVGALRSQAQYEEAFRKLGLGFSNDYDAAKFKAFPEGTEVEVVRLNPVHIKRALDDDPDRMPANEIARKLGLQLASYPEALALQLRLVERGAQQPEEFIPCATGATARFFGNSDYSVYYRDDVKKIEIREDSGLWHRKWWWLIVPKK